MKKSTQTKFLTFLILIGMGVCFSDKILAAQTQKNIKTPTKHTLLYVKKKFFEEFSYIIPGTTTEDDFLRKNPDLVAYDEDGDPDTNSIYVLQNELKESGYYYDKAILNFENGLLEWVNLIPKNLSIMQFLKTTKNSYKIEDVDAAHQMYDFTSFILIVDKKTKLVQSIGVFRGGLKF